MNSKCEVIKPGGHLIVVNGAVRANGVLLGFMVNHPSSHSENNWENHFVSDNTRWLKGKADNLAADWGSFHLIIIAKAFHWMGRESILDILYNSANDNGGIAIIDNDIEKQEPVIWQLKVNELVKLWLGNDRRAGNSTYTPPKERFEDTVAKSRFKDVERHVLTSYSYTWTVDSIIGNLYSTSFASKHHFGDNLERFEDSLKSALLQIDSTGVFTEEMAVSIITAMK